MEGSRRKDPIKGTGADIRGLNCEGIRLNGRDVSYRSETPELACMYPGRSETIYRMFVASVNAYRKGQGLRGQRLGVRDHE